MQSDKIGSLALALSKAQGQMENAKKDAQNEYNKSRYATLASVQDAIRLALSQNELSYTQTTSSSEVGDFLRTTLMHSSGEWVASENKIPTPQPNKMLSPIQAYGATLTYLKRYQLSALVGVSVADEDSDGVSQSSKKPSKQTSKQTTGQTTQQASGSYNPEKFMTDVNQRLKEKDLPEYEKLSHLAQVIGEGKWPRPEKKDDWIEAGKIAIQHKAEEPFLLSIIENIRGFNTKKEVKATIKELGMKITPNDDDLESLTAALSDYALENFFKEGE